MAKKKPETKEKIDPLVLEAKINRKMYKLANAIRIPPPINQFKTVLEDADEKRVFDLFAKYKPETREEKQKRLESANPREGPKPILIKFGLKHLTDLISAKKTKLVLIAADVCPITVVVWLPSLCKRMGISYAIVKSRASLGALVNLKSAAAIALESVRPEDAAEFEEIIGMCNAVFADQYEHHMTTSGGGRINLPVDADCKKETFTN